MKEILKTADDLIGYAKQNLELDERNVFYVRNRILEILSDSGEEMTAD